MENRRFIPKHEAEDQKEVQWFEKVWKRDGFEVVGFLEERFETGEGIMRVVLEGSRTPYGCGRRIGNRIVIAKYSQYDSWNMETGEYLTDVNDF